MVFVVKKGGKDTETSMLPPPPSMAAVGLEVGGGGGDAGSTGSNMRKLLEDLHRSRIRFEQDQKALDKTRQEIDKTNGRISKLKLEGSKSNEKFVNLVQAAALKKTELNGVEIRSKVINETLKKAESELNAALEELYQVRTQASQVSSSFLSEAVDFGLQWNGTELGQENRMLFAKNDIENLERQKRQLDFELSDFLILQKGVHECEKEVKELDQKFQEHDADISKQEEDLRTRINDLDVTLQDLEHEEEQFRQSSFKEIEGLQKKIDETQSSINSLQNQNTEANAAVKSQKNSAKISKSKESAQQELQSHHPEISTSTFIETSKENQPFNLNVQKPFDSKARLSRYQVPVKPIMQQPRSSNGNSVNDHGSTTFSNNGLNSSTANCCDGSFPESQSNSNDEDIYLAAAEVSQNFRSYEPMAPMPCYTENGPTPSKVRAVEQQGQGSTTFMKQLSSAKVIKRPSRSSQSQGKNKRKSSANVSKPAAIAPDAPTRTSLPSSGKTFQFKKKLSSSHSLGNCNQVNSTNISESSHNEGIVDSTIQEDNYEYEHSDFFNGGHTGGDGIQAKPYSCFNSSRILLTESQDQRL